MNSGLNSKTAFHMHT